MLLRAAQSGGVHAAGVWLKLELAVAAAFAAGGDRGARGGQDADRKYGVKKIAPSSLRIFKP